jgi:hypothetical protein
MFGFVQLIARVYTSWSDAEWTQKLAGTDSSLVDRQVRATTTVIASGRKQDDPD